MNENECTVDGKTYIALDDINNNCKGCDLNWVYKPDECSSSGPCSKYKRKDERNIIWKEKVV